ncbi:MAG TPA: glycosyltransferase family 4 protein [Bryobacteraceae bacterium]|nr:glycosyltransferase family 4 protein [Bryobacteraceae bacterium]
MKILLVIEATLGGCGRHVLDLAEALLARRNEVHLVYSPVRMDRAFAARVTSLSASRPELHHHSIPIARELAFSDLRSYLELARYVYRNGPFDVIHAHSTKAGFLTRLVTNRRGAPVVYTPHGLMTLNPRLQGLRRRAVCVLESALSRLCSAVIVVSEAERRCALATGIPARKLVTIPNGVDPSGGPREAIRAEWGLSRETICIGWVGRLVEYKGPSRILDAFALMKRRTTVPVRLIVIGWGPLENSLRQQAAQLHISDHVTFAGEVDGPPHIAAMDVLAHTSSFEAFAYVFLEAFSAGVPVVATRVGGAEDLVEDGVTGYICDPWDRGVFARLLQRVVEDPELRSSMGASARERAVQFTVNAMVNSTSEVYHRVCRRSYPVLPHTVAAPGNQQ